MDKDRPTLLPKDKMEIERTDALETLVRQNNASAKTQRIILILTILILILTLLTAFPVLKEINNYLRSEGEHPAHENSEKKALHVPHI